MDKSDLLFLEVGGNAASFIVQHESTYVLIIKTASCSCKAIYLTLAFPRTDMILRGRHANEIRESSFATIPHISNDWLLRGAPKPAFKKIPQLQPSVDLPVAWIKFFQARCLCKAR